MKLSFITPIAYDFKYAKHAIRSYYDIADEIILGLDQALISWSGKKFELDVFGDLGRFVRDEDPQRKIKVSMGNFHEFEEPLANETAERNLLSRFATGDWIVSIDSDEILVNPKEFRDWLEILPPEACRYQLSARLMTVFKTFPGDIALLPTPPYEAALVATQCRGAYFKARMTEQARMQSPLSILHYGWGRTREELVEKLKHWGHSKDHDWEEYLEFWDSITLDNYKETHDFHPLRPLLWNGLEARAGIKEIT